MNINAPNNFSQVEPVRQWPASFFDDDSVDSDDSDDSVDFDDFSSEDLSAPFSACSIESQRASPIAEVQPSALATPENYTQELLHELSFLNKSSDILYEADLCRHDPKAKKKSADFRAQLRDLGFTYEIRGLVACISYRGDTPAKALDELVAVRPLLLDCGLALNLAKMRALKRVLGDIGFCRFITNSCHGKLSISSALDSPFYNHTAYYHDVNHAVTKRDVENIQVGDVVYIASHPTSLLLKPSSELTGYNLVCSSIDETGRRYFKGFQSSVDSDFTFEELEAIFLNAHNSNFTYEDLQIITENFMTSPDEMQPHATETNKQFFEKLVRLCGESLMAEGLKSLQMSLNKRYEASSVKVPQEMRASVIMGIMFIDSLNRQSFEDIARTGRTRNWPKQSIQVENVLPQEPCQETLRRATLQFYNDCLQSQSSPRYGGLFLFGDPGVGKTHSCTKVVEKLEQEHGMRVLRKTPTREFLTQDEYTQAIRLSLDRGDEQVIESLVSRFKTTWQDFDLIFIDDVNELVSEHTLVARSLLTFARRHKKMVLVTSNNPPFGIFSSNQIDPHYDALQLVEVRGENFRAGAPWWNTTVDLPETGAMHLPTGEPLSDKQQEIMKWAKKLELQSAHNRTLGLAIYGSPGIGKSTAVKLALATKKSLWIDGTNAHAYTDFRKAVLDSDCDFVVIDDANEGYLNKDYREICLGLCTTEWLVNKNNQAVKVIIISNNMSDEKFINDLSLLKDELKPKIKSRFLTTFYPLQLGVGADFRLQNRGKQSRGYVIKPSNREAINAIASQYPQQELLQVDLKSFALNLTILCNLERRKEMTAYRKELSDKIASCRCFIIHWNDNPNFGFEIKELLQILDCLDANNAKVVFVTDKMNFVGHLEELLKDVSGNTTGKYTSRLAYIET